MISYIHMLRSMLRQAAGSVNFGFPTAILQDIVLDEFGWAKEAFMKECEKQNLHCKHEGGEFLLQLKKRNNTPVV